MTLVWGADRWVWYELPLVDYRSSVPMPAGFRLERIPEIEAGQLAERYGGPGRADIQRWRDHAALWRAMKSDELVITFCVFSDLAPVASATEWLTLPPGTGCLSVWVTSVKTYAGRGIASGVGSEVYEHICRSGVTKLIAEVHDDNAASRRALEKAGFTEMADTSVRIRLGRKTAAVHPRTEFARELLCGERSTD